MKDVGLSTCKLSSLLFLFVCFPTLSFPLRSQFINTQRICERLTSVCVCVCPYTKSASRFSMCGVRQKRFGQKRNTFNDILGHLCRGGADRLHIGNFRIWAYFNPFISLICRGVRKTAMICTRMLLHVCIYALRT